MALYKFHRPVGLNSKHLSLTILEVGSSRSRYQEVTGESLGCHFLRMSLYGLSLACEHEGEMFMPLPLLIRTLIPSEDPHLHDPI